MAFATSTQLATRLGRTFTDAEAGQVAALLDDATAYLQAELGGQLIEAGTTTVTMYAEGDRLRQPQAPIRAVTTVTRDGLAVTGYEIRDRDLVLDTGWGTELITVTYDYGVAAVRIGLDGPYKIARFD